MSGHTGLDDNINEGIEMSTLSLTLISDAETLLRSGAPVTVVQLLRLIHNVNPTSRGIGDTDRKRRYALKAHLQSLLIRRFPNDLRLLPGDEPGVISLLYGNAGADACHVVIEELDEDARSWITYQLDTGAIDEEVSVSSLGALSRRFSGERVATTQDNEVTGLVAAGKLALVEYDYERAALHFQQAQQVSQGAVEPTLALLEFWIDQMGADHAALELEAHLPRATLANPEVRALLGIAAARTKDIQRAQRLTRGLGGPRAAEVMGLVARAALRTADPGSALPWITQLRSLDPMHPAILDCERELRNLRDEGRLAAESELERLQVSGPLDETDRCANSLLQRWPHSEKALRWVRERAAERAKLAAIQALQYAQREQERGAIREASIILGNAIAPDLGPELRAIVQERRAEIERQLSEVADNERVAEVTATLRGILAEFATRSMREPRVESGLATYLDMPVDLRALVREQVSLPELAWVEPILTRLGTRRAKSAAVAVVALVALKIDIEQHPVEALARLQPYLEVLESMPESSPLVAQARHRVRVQRQALAVEQLHQAQQALAESTENQALCVLEAILPEDLDPKDRELQRELLSVVRVSIELKDLENRLILLHRQGDFFGAKDIASQLAGRTNGDEKLAWIGRCNELRAEIASSWCWMTGSDEIGDVWMSSLMTRPGYAAPEPWVEPGGVTAICFVADGSWLHLIRYQLETARVENWVRMALPKSAEGIELIRVTDEVAVLVTNKASVLVVDLGTWEILAYHESPFLGDWEPVTSVVSRDAHWLWCALSGRQGEYRVQLQDIASRRVIRTFAKADLIPAVSSLDAEVAVLREDCVTFHRSNGGIVSGLTVSASLTVVVQAPSGHGLVGVVEDDEGGDLALLGPIVPSKIPPAELALEGSSSSAHQLAVALDDGVLVVRYDAGDEQWLEAFIEVNGRLSSLYRVRVSSTALLLSDRAGRCVWVLDVENGRLAARRIVREPQRLLFDGPHDVP